MNHVHLLWPIMVDLLGGRKKPDWCSSDPFQCDSASSGLLSYRCSHCPSFDRTHGPGCSVPLKEQHTHNNKSKLPSGSALWWSQGNFMFIRRRFVRRAVARPLSFLHSPPLSLSSCPSDLEVVTCPAFTAGTLQIPSFSFSFLFPLPAFLIYLFFLNANGQNDVNTNT